jgi:hypothetical protein
MKYVMNIPAERIFNKSRFNNQIRNRQLIDNAIHYESAGDDPTIVLPKIELPKSLIKIKIDITSPVKTFVQLYYKTKLFSGYHENQSVRTAVADGRQTIILTIPVFNLFGRLRLDVGSHPGKYVIHSIDIII